MKNRKTGFFFFFPPPPFFFRPPPISEHRHTRAKNVSIPYRGPTLPLPLSFQAWILNGSITKIMHLPCPHFCQAARKSGPLASIKFRSLPGPSAQARTKSHYNRERVARHLPCHGPQADTRSESCDCRCYRFMPTNSN